MNRISSSRRHAACMPGVGCGRRLFGRAEAAAPFPNRSPAGGPSGHETLRQQRRRQAGCERARRQSAAGGTLEEPQGTLSRPRRFLDRGGHFRPVGGMAQGPTMLCPAWPWSTLTASRSKERPSPMSRNRSSVPRIIPTRGQTMLPASPIGCGAQGLSGRAFTWDSTGPHLQEGERQGDPARTTTTRKPNLAAKSPPTSAIAVRTSCFG